MKYGSLVFKFEIKHTDTNAYVCCMDSDYENLVICRLYG
jgi:hypothetical protein